MKTLATIGLSLIAIIASLVLVLSTLCAVNGDLGGTSNRGSYILCALIALAVVAAAMWTNGKLSRKQRGD